MASHSLAIAKASLSASLMRPDPTSIPRDEIALLHNLLGAVSEQGSPKNIQRCKAWLLKNATSTTRITSVGKYLVALSASWGDNAVEGEAVIRRQQKSLVPRKQLHILYVLSDLLHHTKFHDVTLSAYSVLTGALQSHLITLFGLAAAYDPTSCVKHHKKINELLEVWDRHGYYQPPYVGKLRQTINNASSNGFTREGKEPTQLNSGDEEKFGNKDQVCKDTPFIMPASHGDPSTPYYDLPAGNMMPHIIPNSATPINTQLVKPLQFTCGPADNKLVMALKDFMKDIDILYGKNLDVDEESALDIDELGQPIIHDEVSGERIGDSYYGWSKAFSRRMQQRQKGNSDYVTGRTRNDSLDRSQSPHKRRKFSSSESSWSRGRSRSRSWSPSKPRLGIRLRGQHSRNGTSRQSHSRSRSISRSHSRHRPYRTLRSRSRPRSRSRSGTYSPPQQMPLSQKPHSLPPQHALAPVPPLQFPAPFPQGIPLGPAGIPIPPPPPPGYKGSWPPPLGQNLSFTSQGSPFNGFPAFAPPAPPPLQNHRAQNLAIKPLPTGPRSYQQQLEVGAAGWGQHPQQASGGNNGYGYINPHFHPQNHGNRGRGG